jgi:hypothetical protein
LSYIRALPTSKLPFSRGFYGAFLGERNFATVSIFFIFSILKPLADCHIGDD